MTAVVLGLVAVAAVSLAVAWLMSRTTGVRAGAAVVASDVGLITTDTLRDAALRIHGRPDYVVRERGRGRVYPVEVKPTRSAAILYESDALQLATYMLLIQAQYGPEFAGYGVVRYRSAEFRVLLTAELRGRCIAAADGVRAARRAPTVHRNHTIAAKCGSCAVRAVCDEALVD
jgi:CRISPR/Cas system-associated exonuclease Cas4 (RecB family)